MLIANGASGECRIADPSRLSSLMMLTQRIGRLGTCKGEDHNDTRLVVLIEVRSGRTLIRWLTEIDPPDTKSIGSKLQSTNELQ